MLSELRIGAAVDENRETGEINLAKLLLVNRNIFLFVEILIYALDSIERRYFSRLLHFYRVGYSMLIAFE